MQERVSKTTNRDVKEVEMGEADQKADIREEQVAQSVLVEDDQHIKVERQEETPATTQNNRNQKSPLIS